MGFFLRDILGQPFFIKACFLKAVVNVRCDNEIVFVSHQLQKVIVNRLGDIHIAVDVDIPTPVRPMLLRRGKRIKAAGIHIPDRRQVNNIGNPFCGGFTLQICVLHLKEISADTYAWSEKAREEKKTCDREIITLEDFQQWLRDSKI